MIHHAKRVGVQILGWIFVILGIAGLVLPVLQGILFLMIGLYLLSREYHWARRWTEALHTRYPQVFRRARYWQARLGLRQANNPGDPEPLSPVRRVAVYVALAAFFVMLSMATGAATRFAVSYWGELRHRYQVVDVSQEDSAQVVELRRTWALKDRRYILRCHICEPVEVGASYSFVPVPGENPPMMKRIANPGEVPDFYTVVEGKLPN